MKVVGVGCGPGMLTEAAIAAIRDAKEIYGSERAIERAAGQIPADCAVHVITDYKTLRSLPETAVVLSTGDPMLAGLGFLGGDVISGISSYQYACAKLHIPMTKTVIVNAHAKDHEQAITDILFEIHRGKIAFIIADPAFDVAGLAKQLQVENQLCRIAVCERLGYPDESIQIGDVHEPPRPSSSLFVVFAGFL